MNSDLVGNEYIVPDNILQHLSNCITQGRFNGEDVSRAQHIVDSGKISYDNLKKILSDIDKDNIQITDPGRYNLWGGDTMKLFASTQLGNERNRVQNTKKSAEYTQNLSGINGMVQNPHNKTHEKKESDKIDVASLSKPNSDINTAAGLRIPKLAEQINRIKKLML